MLLDVGTAFKRVFGRSPTAAEQSQLAAWQAAWNIRGNEVLVAVAMLVCRTQPDRDLLLERCTAAVRGAFESASHGPCDEARSRAVEIAPRPPRTSTAVAAGVAGALSWLAVAVGCLAAGASSAGRWHGPTHPPRWLERTAFASVLTAPCGWTVLVALATPAAYAAGWAWSLARGRDARARRLGRGVLVALAVVVGGWTAGLLTL